MAENYTSKPTDFKAINEWQAEERPREKLLANGAAALTKSELIAILLGTGTTQKSAVDLGKELLEIAHHNLDELARLGLRAMTRIKGIGPAKAVTLIAALELGRRKQLDAAKRNHQHITSSKQAFELLQPIIGDLPYEEFYVLYMNATHKIIHQQSISSGGLAATVVDVRRIMKPAVQVDASHLLVAHNHPSGSLRPSTADLSITKKIKEAALVLDMRLSDHIIVTSAGYLSFADEGIL